MSVLVSAIQFNNDPADKRSSALNLRRNLLELLPLPEWQRDSDEESVAAYAILQTTIGDGIRIRARFARTEPGLQGVEVRAVQAPRPEFPWWLAPLPPPAAPTLFDDYAGWLYRYAYALWLMWIAAGTNVLGEVKPRWVQFGPDGTTEMEPFELQNVRLASRGVGVYRVNWLWQYRTGPTQPWTNVEVTHHRIYAALDLATAPWTPVPLDPTGAGLPWSEALEVACTWAAGALTRDDVARRITEGVWAMGGGRLEYGCPIGAMEMYANTPLGIFNCTAFLDRVHGGVGNGRFVNCTDCASMVTTLTNVLGCDLWQARMGMYNPSFMTEPIRAIGSSAWQSPCGWNLGFSYHEVAWAGACTFAEPVWDACLQVDGGTWPLGPVIPLLPVRMRFGLPGQRHYRDRLAAGPMDQVVCEPRPWERRRRTVV